MHDKKSIRDRCWPADMQLRIWHLPHHVQHEQFVHQLPCRANQAWQVFLSRVGADDEALLGRAKMPEHHEPMRMTYRATGVS